MNNDKVTRKDFLKQLSLLGVVTAGAGSLLSACGGSQEEQPPAGKDTSTASKQTEDPCSDLSGLTDQEKQTRKQFQYVAESPNPEKLCSNCSLYTQPEGESPCGGCTLIKGAIHPDGYCTAWAAKQ